MWVCFRFCFFVTHPSQDYIPIDHLSDRNFKGYWDILRHMPKANVCYIYD